MDDLIIIKVDDLKKMIRDIVEAQTSVILEAINAANTQKQKPAKLFSKKEAAEFLGVSIPTIDNLRRRNQLACKKVGGQIRIRRQDLLEFIE